MIERFGGVIEKVIGDAVMAVWGAEVDNEDDAERTVRAAFELVDIVGNSASSGDPGPRSPTASQHDVVCRPAR